MCRYGTQTERENDSFSSNDFHWNEKAKEYRRPADNPLCSEGRAFKNVSLHVTKANIFFRSRPTDCVVCHESQVLPQHCVSQDRPERP